jgi:hypothetical protein
MNTETIDEKPAAQVEHRWPSLRQCVLNLPMPTGMRSRWVREGCSHAQRLFASFARCMFGSGKKKWVERFHRPFNYTVLFRPPSCTSLKMNI